MGQARWRSRSSKRYRKEEKTAQGRCVCVQSIAAAVGRVMYLCVTALVCAMCLLLCGILISEGVHQLQCESHRVRVCMLCVCVCV